MAKLGKWTIPKSLQPAEIDPASADLELEHYITFRISALSKMLDRRSARFLSDNFGISLTERRILGRLTRYGGSTVRDLASVLAVDKGRISRAAASLIALGCVNRETDPADARSAIFTITPAGRALEGDIVERGRDRQVELLNQLEPEERRVLYVALGKMRDFLDEDVPGLDTVVEHVA